MRTSLFFCLIPIGLAGCGTNAADSTGWSLYDGTPVKGNAALEQQFQSDEGKCQGRDVSVYKFCMSSRGYAQGVVIAAGTPVISTAPAVISAASPDWRARAAEARAVATQLRDPVSKQMMTGIAETYDRLAGYSEGRSPAGSKLPLVRQTPSRGDKVSSAQNRNKE